MTSEAFLLALNSLKALRFNGFSLAFAELLAKIRLDLFIVFMMLLASKVTNLQASAYHR
jgi:hypothetical protein